MSIDGTTALAGAPQASQVASGAGAAYVFGLRSDNGDACSTDDECASGYWVEGLCCDTACGGDDPADCQVCSVATGGTTDGVCAALADGTDCDDGLYCSGTETCRVGVCGNSTGAPCPGADGDSDCVESCDEASDDCGSDDPDGSACESGQCSAGVCEPTGGGGAGGAGGTAGTGGTVGTGGAGGTAGTGATGGISGTAGAGGASAPPGAESDDQGGCACRLDATRRVSSRWGAGGLLGVGLALARRRRRSS